MPVVSANRAKYGESISSDSVLDRMNENSSAGSAEASGGAESNRLDISSSVSSQG